MVLEEFWVTLFTDWSFFNSKSVAVFFIGVNFFAMNNQYGYGIGQNDAKQYFEH